MVNGVILADRQVDAASMPALSVAGRRRARMVPVSRRGPVLQAARGADPALGLYGLDLTAGCGHGCTYCHIRGTSRFPGDGLVRFDPATNERLVAMLDSLPEPPRQVVLSPSSDPLPPDREVRAETLRVARTLLERGIPVTIMTRGRIGRRLVELLAEHRSIVRVAVGTFTRDRDLACALEPNAAAPDVRLRGIARLLEAGVPVEVRVEPLISGLTDTRENLAPLFGRLASLGVSEIVTHYLFLPARGGDRLAESLARFGWAERVLDGFVGGPAFVLGSVGATKHLPVEVRRAGLARLLSWGAEFGLRVRTGRAQNPDLPRGDGFGTAPAPVSTPPARWRPEPSLVSA